jgi:hypothetical protein
MQVDIQLAPGSHSTEAAGAILLNALHCNKTVTNCSFHENLVLRLYIYSSFHKISGQLPLLLQPSATVLQLRSYRRIAEF